MVLIWTDEYEYTFVASFDRGFTRDDVAARAKSIGGSFGDSIATRVCDCFFPSLVDLEVERSTYYALEYASLDEFLLNKMGLSSEAVVALTNGHHEGRIIARGDSSSGGDYLLCQLSESETGSKILAGLLDLHAPAHSDVEHDEYEDQE